MEINELILGIGGIMLSIISFFLKRTMDELKDLKQTGYECRNKISLLEMDHLNKYEHLTDKFDVLCISVRDLTSEIKELNKELNKKKGF